MHRIGCRRPASRFDNERPAHQVLLQPARIARRLVTNAQWLAFMADGGYATPSLWLSDGWAMVAGGRLERTRLLAASIDGAWLALTLGGLAPGRSRRAGRATSATTKPMRSPAGPAGTCRPRRNGRWRRAPASLDRRLRRGLAMDAQRLLALSGLPRRRRRARRVQRQVHGQPDGAARQLACHAGRAFARELSQFLLSAGALAVHRPAACWITTHERGDPRCAVPANGRCTRRCARRIEAAAADAAFPRDVLAGLDRAARSAFRRSISTTRPARGCSRRSPRWRNIIRPAASSRSCARARPRSHASCPPAARWSSSARGRAARPACCSRPRPQVAAYVPVDISGEMLEQEASAAAPRSSRPCGAAVRGRFHPAVRAAGGDRRHAACRLLPGLDHRQFRAARGGRVPAQCRRSARPGRGADHRRRSGEGSRRAQRRL